MPDFNVENTAKLEKLMSNYIKNSSITSASPEFIAEVQTLLENGADPTVAISGINTPLLTAILKGDEALCRCLITADKERHAINKKDTWKNVAENTPLILAIKRGLYDTALLLLENGADPNEPSGFQGYTPLHFAVALLGTEYQRREQSKSDFHAEAQDPNDPNDKLLMLIEKLIEKGANPSAKNCFEITPHYYLTHRFTENEIQRCVYVPSEAMQLASRAKVSLQLAKLYLVEKEKFTTIDDDEGYDREILDVAGFNAWIMKQDNATDFMLLQKAEQRDKELHRQLSQLERAEKLDGYKVLRAEHAEFLFVEKTFYTDELDTVLARMGLPKMTFDELMKQTSCSMVGADLGHSIRNDAESIYSAVTWHREKKDLVKGLTVNRTTYFEDHPVVQGRLTKLFAEANAREAAMPDIHQAISETAKKNM